MRTQTPGEAKGLVKQAVPVVSRRQRGLLQEKNQPTASFPSPPWSLLLRLGLQLQADTNGALIATGNLSGGGSWASRRRWGPGCTPLSWPPPRSQPPSCPALLLWGPSLIHTSLFLHSTAAPSSRDPSYCPSGGTPKLGLTLGVGPPLL